MENLDFHYLTILYVWVFGFVTNFVCIFIETCLVEYLNEPKGEETSRGYHLAFTITVLIPFSCTYLLGSRFYNFLIKYSFWRRNFL